MPRLYDLRAAHLAGLEISLIPDERIQEAGADLAHGKLNLGFIGLPIPEFDGPIDEEFWQTFPENHGNTFALYLCGLRPVYLLAASAVEARDPERLRQADVFVSSFAAHAAGPRPADMTFNDHAISERIENLTYLLQAANDLEYELQCHDQVADLVHNDALLLLEGHRYQARHNHGIIADRAVMLAAVLLGDEDRTNWIDRAIQRLRLQVAHAFGDDGVHCENSFDYHLTITMLLANCVELLQLLREPYASELSNTIDNACEFIAYALKPNQRTPLFGDSKGATDGTRRIEPYLRLLPDSHQHIEYVMSAGQSGQRPASLLKHFSSGYVFLRSSFDADSFADATWVSLRAGYTTRVHKQRDDLAIGLYSKGHDILVDSGMAGYMPHDPVTRHMASVEAHTTTAVEGKSQTLAAASGRKFRIVAAREESNWGQMTASNHAIPGVAIYRHLYYLRQSDVLIIHDEFISDVPHTYLQYFKLAPEISLTTPGDEGLTLAIGSTGFVADLIQLAGHDSLQLSVGKSGVPMSVVSTGFGTVRPTQTLTYRATGNTVDLVTAIRIRRGTDDPVPVTHDDERITVGKVEVPRTRSTPPRYYGSKVSAAGTLIHLTNEPGPGAADFAVYAYDLRDGSVLYKHGYTAARTMTIENPDRIDCALVYFVRNADRERTEGIVALCRYRERGVELLSYPELHTPLVRGTSQRATHDNEFEFSVDLDYDLSATFRWWVYRNGANIQHISSGERLARFTFDRPGTYVVMCSIVDPLFGESWFEHFDPVQV